MALSCISELAEPTLARIGECIAQLLTHQFNYLCCFSDNIKSLEDEAERLEDERARLQGDVDAAKANAKAILPAVERWLEETREILTFKREHIDPKIANSRNRRLNIKSRYSLSKEAKDTAEEMKELLNRSNFESITQSPRPACETPIQLEKTILEFQSRKSIEDDIVKFLEPREFRIAGIGGMGGVGKTTMANKIMNRMLKEKLVDEAIKVVVAQQPDMSIIQLEMAEQLGFTELEKCKTLQERARQLSIRLKDKRILIVLDDIWTVLKLAELGIYCEGTSAGYSILLTSRSEKVLKRMDTQLFAMEILNEMDAWTLFKEKAGACVGDRNLVSIAEKVAKECKGLPLAIITVGSALKDEKKPVWKDALRQLTRHNPKDTMENVSEKVYAPLRLSYNVLKNDYAKRLFLLCSIFPDDFEISLNNLALYSMGLKMFEGVDSLGEVRDKVFTEILELISRSLLMKCDDENKVKMHDITRDVAIFIAKEEKLLGAKHEYEGQYDRNCKWISVFTNSTNVSFDCLGELSFPSLQLLAIHPGRQSKIDDISCFAGMKVLNVLFLRDCSFQSQRRSVTFPKSLQTLQLKNCSLRTLSFVGALSNLEILNCYKCYGIEEIPVEFGRLIHLKLLDLSGCSDVKRIAPGVIIKLVELEELKMLDSFDGWESSKVKGEDKRNVALNELQSLQKLRCLEIQIQDNELAKEEIFLSPQIEKYAIYIGSKGTRRLEKVLSLRVNRENVLSLSGFPRNTNFANWIQKLVTNSDQEIYSDRDGSTNLDLSQVYNEIKVLVFTSCEIPSLANLVKTPNQNAFFCSLGRICIEKCHKLRNLFSLQRANNGIIFSQLELIVIINCEMMEEILFINEKHNGNANGTIIFSKLVKLWIMKMPRLATIVRGAEMIEFPLLEELNIQNCPKLKIKECPMKSDPKHNYDDKSLHLFGNTKVHFNGLKKLEVEGYNEELWCPQISSCFFQTLETLTIWKCDKLNSLFAPSIVENLVKLNDLWIKECEEMEEVVRMEKESEGSCDGEMHTAGVIIFPNLKRLRLYKLPRLTTLGKGIQGMEFPMLNVLEVICCPNLKKSICSSSISSCTEWGRIHNHNYDVQLFHLFCHPKVKFGTLKKLIIYEVDGVNNLWCQQIPQQFYRTLEILIIKYCRSINTLFSSSMAENLVNLDHLWIKDCGKMEEVIMIDKGIDEISKEKCGVIEKEKDDDGDCGGGSGSGKAHHITFPKLKTIELEDLPNLASFGRGMESIEFPMLENLKIKCPKLIGMVDPSKKSKNNNNEEKGGHKEKPWDETFLCSGGVGIHGRNKDLRITGVGNPKSLWQQIPQHFYRALKELNIDKCQNTKNLFSPSMVENLVNLDYLCIKNCEEMEEVIIVDKGRDEISKEKVGRKNEENDDDCGGGGEIAHHIIFPKLRMLWLIGLPKLGSFGKGVDSIEFPMLKDLNIWKCPELIGIEGHEHNHGDEDSHLLSNSKVKFFVLERIWIEDCKSLKSLFSYAMIDALGNLRLLQVKRCDHMGTVITGDKEIHGNSMLFPSLKTIKFKDLPLLRMFCARKDVLNWPCLEDISIKGCPQLELLTPGSVSTPSLCKITVLNKVFKEGEWNEMEDLNSFLQHLMSTKEESLEIAVEYGESSKNVAEIEEEEQT